MWQAEEQPWENGCSTQLDVVSAEPLEASLLTYRKTASRLAALTLWVAAGALFAAGPAAAAPMPFELVKGSWGGGGSLTLEKGKSEKLSCTAYYTSSRGGRNLGVALRCAGQTSGFELRSHLDNNAGKVSGTWEERTFNASGNASGTLKPGSITLHFHGGVSGDMSVAFSASSQSIAISISTGGAAVTGVHLNLSRR